MMKWVQHLGIVSFTIFATLGVFSQSTHTSKSSGVSAHSAKPEFFVSLGNTTYRGVQTGNVGAAVMVVSPLLANSPPFVAVVVVVQNNRRDEVTLDAGSFELVDSNGGVHPEMDDPSVNARAFDAQLKPGVTQTGTIFFLVPADFRIDGSVLRFRIGSSKVFVDLPVKTNSSSEPRPVSSTGSPTTPGRGEMSDSDEEQYRPSDQMFTPVELRTSIYKYKGQSGILDTYALYWGSDEYLGGQKFGEWASPTLRLARMIDEHTAIYDILMLQRGTGPEPEGEIAVRLLNSDPPDPKRLWRVLVEGVLVGENESGGRVEVPAVRFEGYKDEPARKVDPPNPASSLANIIASRRIYFVEPQYPRAAKLAHMSGTVVMRATISKTGTVEKLQVVSSTNGLFNDAAMDAVKQWRYRPYLVNNDPTEIETTVTVGFALDGGG